MKKRSFLVPFVLSVFVALFGFLAAVLGWTFLSEDGPAFPLLAGGVVLFLVGAIWFSVVWREWSEPVPSRRRDHGHQSRVVNLSGPGDGPEASGGVRSPRTPVPTGDSSSKVYDLTDS